MTETTAQELRRGNLILSPAGYIQRVGGIDTDHIRFNGDEKWHEAEKCKGIPLSEEWLKMLGMDDGIFPANNSFSIQRSNASEIDWGIYFDDDFVGEYIRFVHQLQNLYFALIGHELKLNNQ